MPGTPNDCLAKILTVHTHPFFLFILSPINMILYDIYNMGKLILVLYEFSDIIHAKKGETILIKFICFVHYKIDLNEDSH